MAIMESSLGRYDIIVGIPTKNNGQTIKKVVETASEGLNSYFPTMKSLIVIADGFSLDDTRKNAKSAKLHENQDIIVTKHGGGRGSAVRYILGMGKLFDADVVSLMDADLRSTEPSWLDSQIEAVLDGTDLVIPSYRRSKFDGVITNNVVYPIVYSLFGNDIRQPMVTERACSRKFVDLALSYPLFPNNWGVHVLFTTLACAEDLKIKEAEIGVKIYQSRKNYLIPEHQLMPKLMQTTAEIFFQVYNYMNSWKKIESIRQIEKIPYAGEYGELPPLEVDITTRKKKFAEALKRFEGVYKKFLPEEVHNKIITNKPKIDDETWCKIVFHYAYTYCRGYQSNEILESFVGLWNGRVAKQFETAASMGEHEFEDIIHNQVDLFLKNKQIAIDLFSKPEIVE
jgi:glycosyltransferase involved in cell wall biosynthesis